MYRQKLKSAQPKLFTSMQRRRIFLIKRFRWIGLTLMTVVLCLIADISIPPSSTSPLVASAAISTPSEWVSAVTAQKMRLDKPAAAISTPSEWVSAVTAQKMVQRMKLDTHSFNSVQ